MRMKKTTAETELTNRTAAQLPHSPNIQLFCVGVANDGVVGSASIAGCALDILFIRRRAK